MIQSQLFQPFTPKPISLLSEAGEWTGRLRSSLTTGTLQSFYRDMLAARLLDERYSKLQRSGKTSFVAPAAGHEAAQVGVAHAVKPKFDWLFLTTGTRGWCSPWASRRWKSWRSPWQPEPTPTGAARCPRIRVPKDYNVFTVASPIASHVPPAVGAAISMKLQGTGQVVVTSFGDGATSEGDFHAGINFAGAQGAPIVFVCENNRYAISVDYHKQTAAETIAAKAQAYGMPGYFVDGMDVLACYFVMKEAVARARAGLGPSLVEMLVYPLRPPLVRRRRFALPPPRGGRVLVEARPLGADAALFRKRDLWSRGWDDEQRAAINKTFADAVKEAEAAGEVPLEWMFEDVYAEVPRHLREQRETLKQD